MKSKTTRSIALLVTLLWALMLTACAIDVVAPTDAFYVNDQSDILSPETEEYILTTATSLDDQTGAQICVVAVDFLGGEDIADYAYALFNEWGIGSAEENNGVLLLLAIGEENYFATQGKGLEDVLTFGKLQTILDEELEPDFAVENYDAGVRKTYDALLAALCSHYGVTAGENAPAYTQPSQDWDEEYWDDYYWEDTSDDTGVFEGLVITVFAIAVIVIIIVAIVAVTRSLSGVAGSDPHNPNSYLHHQVRPPRPPYSHGPRPGGFGMFGMGFGPRPGHRPGGMGGFGSRPGSTGGFGPRPGARPSRPSASRPSYSRPSRPSSSRPSRPSSSRPRTGGGGSSRGGGAGRRR